MDEIIKRSVAHRKAGLSRTSAWRRERDDPTVPRAVQLGPMADDGTQVVRKGDRRKPKRRDSLAR
jgi:hypothetical protein